MGDVIQFPKIETRARDFNERIMYLILRPGELTKEEWAELEAYEKENENV